MPETRDACGVLADPIRIELDGLKSIAADAYSLFITTSTGVPYAAAPLVERAAPAAGAQVVTALTWTTVRLRW